MSIPKRSWRPDSSKPEDIANVRVCLALLRIYREVQLPHDEMDMTDVARPFWPLVRQHRALFKTAIEGTTAKGRKLRPGPTRRSREETQEELAQWLDTNLRRGRSLQRRDTRGLRPGNYRRGAVMRHPELSPAARWNGGAALRRGQQAPADGREHRPAGGIA
jgi:hypothetical protein